MKIYPKFFVVVNSVQNSTNQKLLAEESAFTV